LSQSYLHDRYQRVLINTENSDNIFKNGSKWNTGFDTSSLIFSFIY
jgi:hypothetical protein